MAAFQVTFNFCFLSLNCYWGHTDHQTLIIIGVQFLAVLFLPLYVGVTGTVLYVWADARSRAAEQGPPSQPGMLTLATSL